MSETKYIPPPHGCDGLVPVHQADMEIKTKDHLLYLKGVADASGYVCISDELMREICDQHHHVSRHLERVLFQLDAEKDKTARLAKKLKETKK